jgi:hypothetical protein
MIGFSFNNFVEEWASSTQDPYVFTYDRFLGFGHPIPALVSAGSAVAYLILVYLVAPLLRPTTSSATRVLEKLRKIHNIVLFLFSFVCFSSTLIYMIASGEIASLRRTLCDDPPRWMSLLNTAFTFSKIYEWGDTLFLVWLSPRGANSFLHVYHHATTFWLFLLVSDLPGPLRMGLLLNGFVHTLMYAHYAWPFPKAVVPAITAAQIAQLATVTYLWTITPSTCERFSSFPEDYWLEFLTPYSMVPVYLLFFVQYFMTRFLFGSRKRTTSGKSSSTAVENKSAVSRR